MIGNTATRGDQQQRVDLDLGARGNAAHDEIRVGVARQQCRLEKDEARRPDRGGAAEPRQDLLRDHRLYEEQQESADEDGGGVEGH